MAATALQAGVSLIGLGVLITRSAVIFAALRYAGAAYLAWSGLSGWRWRTAEAPERAPRPRRSSEERHA